jgi:hypothetical protein
MPTAGKSTRGIGRHLNRPAGQLRLPDQRGAAALVRALHADLRAEGGQHQFGVIAGFLRLDHAGLAGRVQAGQQHRRLHLGGGDRQDVVDRHRIGRPGHGERQSAAAARGDLGADPAQRLDHPAHRTPAQRGVAGHHRAHRMPRQHAHQEPGTGPGIAEVEHLLRRDEGTHAAAPDAPGLPVAAAIDGRAQRRHRIGGGDHIRAGQQPVDRGLASGERPQHQRAVGDRLVARHARPSGQPVGRPGGQRTRGRMRIGHGSWRRCGGAVGRPEPTGESRLCPAFSF